MMNASYSNLNENLCLEYCYFAFPKNLYLDRCLSIIYNAIIVYLIHSKNLLKFVVFGKYGHLSGRLYLWKVFLYMIMMLHLESKVCVYDG